LANGEDFTARQTAKNEWTIYYYLYYTHWTSVDSLRHDSGHLMIPVSNKWSYWIFNLRTLAWQYDPASISIFPPPLDPSLHPILYLPTPLLDDTGTLLDNNAIIECFEKNFVDFLRPIASSGQTRDVTDLSEYARHGYLTLGGVVDRTKPGLQAHFLPNPSFDSEWTYLNYTDDLDVHCSPSAPWRVDFTFHDQNENQLNLHFRLGCSKDDQNHLRTAYLSQSLPLCTDCEDVNDLVFVDELRYSLVGTFSRSPTTLKSPVYLFVQPPSVEYVNDMHCVVYPLPEPTFYWSLDSGGRDTINKENWERYDIPELEEQMWIGSWWYWVNYKVVQVHLSTQCYDLEGREYARDYGYPELIYLDPHDSEFVDLEDSVIIRESSSDSDSDLSLGSGNGEGVRDSPWVITTTRGRPTRRAGNTSLKAGTSNSARKSPTRLKTRKQRKANNPGRGGVILQAFDVPVIFPTQIEGRP
ncbi:hypothetical protein PQX77_002702, partial [Marasmius sp. AFHP31]